MNRHLLAVVVAAFVALSAACGETTDDLGPEVESTDEVAGSVDSEDSDDSEEVDGSEPSEPAESPESAPSSVATTSSTVADETTTSSIDVPSEGTFENLYEFCAGPGFAQAVSDALGDGDTPDVGSYEFSSTPRPSIDEDRSMDLVVRCELGDVSMEFTTFDLSTGSDPEAWARGLELTGFGPGDYVIESGDDGFVWVEILIEPGSLSHTFDAEDQNFRIEFRMALGDGMDAATARAVLTVLTEAAPGPPYSPPIGFPCNLNVEPPFCQ